MRKSGILFPIFSIPSNYGIGTFSKEAYKFVDFLAQAGQKLWQILPLGPTGYGDSPYQSFSTFAGNPYFIDLDTLIADGLLEKKDCDALDFGKDAKSIDYEKIYESRFRILRNAYENSNIEENTDFLRFTKKNEYWLEDYALFMAIKNANDGKSFLEWDEALKLREPSALKKTAQEYADDVMFYKFLQYHFAKQWSALKEYANAKGIEIVGDIPIYVALDSADTWANPEMFQLDETCTPVGVAGCPPDAFSETGQLWGNPLYRWDYHKETGYKWWMQRIAYCYELYDVVRIDHFRGFDEYYFIPYGDKTAEFGHWEKGPGYDIFDTMKKTLGEKQVIAEDLGFLTESVIELVQKCGYPGMKILQFAFDSREDSDYLPHNYIRNCVVYTGTHDNDTTVGWYESLDAKDKDFANRYLNIKDECSENTSEKTTDATATTQVAWELIRAALASVADTAIIPLQDYLGLDTSARINLPSTTGTNWKWRIGKRDCTKKLADRIYKICKLYGRV